MYGEDLEKQEEVLVSVIVPVFNVEKYIEKCICSLVEQNFSNYEIIAVDDSSTDSSLEILNRLQRSYDNLKVFSLPKNSGVSVARNRGIDESRGKFITFVDADDYVSSEYCQYLYNLIDKNKADIAITTHCFTHIGEAQIKKDCVRVYSKSEIIKLFLSQNIVVGCWNKIYRRDLLVSNKVFFSEDLFYGEGLEFTIRSALISQMVVSGEKKIYFYRKNNLDSATTKFNPKKLANGEVALRRIWLLINTLPQSVLSEWKLHYCLFSINAIATVILSKEKALIQKNCYQHWNLVVRHNLKLILRAKIPLKTKIKAILCCINPNLLAVTFSCWLKVRRITSI